MRVKIDGAIDGTLIVECTHILPDRWNGWVQPVFTIRQADEVVRKIVDLGWATEDEAPFMMTHIGYGEWMAHGCTWEVAE